MRTAKFKKANGEHTAKPFKNWHYKITGAHPSYTLTINNYKLADSDRIDLLKDLANQHLNTWVVEAAGWDKLDFSKQLRIMKAGL